MLMQPVIGNRTQCHTAGHPITTRWRRQRGPDCAMICLPGTAAVSCTEAEEGQEEPGAGIVRDLACGAPGDWRLGQESQDRETQPALRGRNAL